MKKKIKDFIKKYLKVIFEYLGYQISLKKIEAKPLPKKDIINLNVAAGNYIIPGFKSLDLYTPHYYKSRKKFLETRIEYDLRKDLKFLASTWVDNGWKTRSFGKVLSDYTGNDGSSAFSLDSRDGKAELFDFDFGFMYAMNENFRIGIHFNQPYIDFYWEFYEF